MRLELASSPWAVVRVKAPRSGGALPQRKWSSRFPLEPSPLLPWQRWGVHLKPPPESLTPEQVTQVDLGLWEHLEVDLKA